MVKDFHVIIPPKFLWSFHHNFNEAWPTKKIFFDLKKKIFLTRKKIFWPQFFFFFLNLFQKSHRNYGDIMPGIWTWLKFIVFMVETFAVWYWRYVEYVNSKLPDLRFWAHRRTLLKGLCPKYLSSEIEN